MTIEWLCKCGNKHFTRREPDGSAHLECSKCGVNISVLNNEISRLNFDDCGKQKNLLHEMEIRNLYITGVDETVNEILFSINVEKDEWIYELMDDVANEIEKHTHGEKGYCYSASQLIASVLQFFQINAEIRFVHGAIENRECMKYRERNKITSFLDVHKDGYCQRTVRFYTRKE